MKNKEKLTPLTESTYLILLSLVDPLHGYGIMQKIENISEGRVKMGPGTLYGGLTSLVEKKMIKRVEDFAGSEERKKMYKITDPGMEILRQEYLRMKQLLVISDKIFNKGHGNG